MKAINNIELANIVEFELDKNLYNMELKRQKEIYNNEIKRLNKEKLKKSKTLENKILKNSGNNKPIINKYTTFNENLLSFYVAKKIKEYDIYQKKLEQKKIEEKDLPISMILFDELGLSEKSKSNPLKVLHSKLEYGGKKEEGNMK